MKTMALAGEAFSRNIGDQAIHACLGYLLRQQDANLNILSLDISQRSALSDGTTLSARYRFFSSLKALTGFSSVHSLANLVVDRVQKARQQDRIWNPVFERNDELVIGGGQLLMDNNLDFPLKLFNLTDLASEKKIPFHISSVGVGRSWSSMASHLFQPVLANAKSITLRDVLSRERLKKSYPAVQARVTFDPAIMAAEVYTSVLGERYADTVGLGVMSREDVNSRLLPGQRFSTQTWLELWMDLLSGLVGQKMKVELFNTGSPQDQRFASLLFGKVQDRGWDIIRLAPCPVTAVDLISRMLRYSLVIATRLHATILANAFGITSLGLAWDEKVNSYYQDTGQADLCFNLVGLNTGTLILASHALNNKPFPETLLVDLKNRARKSVEMF
ncbi:MAG: polysaccharide pyruvyl transferase family protein [Chloroflexota bacterium]